MNLRKYDDGRLLITDRRWGWRWGIALVLSGPCGLLFSLAEGTAYLQKEGFWMLIGSITGAGFLLLLFAPTQIKALFDKQRGDILLGPARKIGGSVQIVSLEQIQDIFLEKELRMVSDRKPSDRLRRLKRGRRDRTRHPEEYYCVVLRMRQGSPIPLSSWRNTEAMQLFKKPRFLIEQDKGICQTLSQVLGVPFIEGSG